MRNLSALLLSATAALAILSAAPASSFAADDAIHNAQRDQEQQDAAALHQSAPRAEAANECRPQYEVYSSHVKWLNNCPSAGQTAYQVYDSHIAWQ